MAPASQRLHATCVAMGDRAVLITGASGSGKSALGLQLMAVGAALVADDQVELTAASGLRACSPTAIRGRIEARGVGLLTADVRTDAEVVLAVDLDRTETERLPPLRHITLLGCAIPLLYRVEGIHFASAIRQILLSGRSDPHA